MSDLFKDVCPVVNVPFNDDETICFEELERIIDHCIISGCKSICLFAFNSEPHKMSTDEKKMVIHEFLQRAAHRIDVLIGLIDNSITGVMELGKIACQEGAKGVILYPPSISCPSGADLAEYFKTIASAVNLPIMIQDNPRSTGVQMSTEFLIKLYEECPQFRFLKVECPFPTRKIQKIVEATHGKIKCYSGNGGIHAIQAYKCGAWGIMPGVSTCKQFVELYRMLDSGKEDAAREKFEKILPLVWFEDQSLEYYIACEKYLLKENGVISSNIVRRPCIKLSENEKKELHMLYLSAIR